jgi:hypothetical protein
MKKFTNISFLLLLLFCQFSFAQDFSKMSKNELREAIEKMSYKCDSLKMVCDNLENAKYKLVELSDALEEKNSKNTQELARLNKLIEANQKERAQKDAETKELIAKLNNMISIQKDSLLNIQSYTEPAPQSNTINKNDFLNSYFFDQAPLNNNSFEFVLTKVIFGRIFADNRNYYYDDDNYKGAVGSLPEILDPADLTFWGVKPNIDITQGSSFNDFIVYKKSEYLNSKFPKIEVLKNKLFTLKYPNGTEESFLFNVKDYNSDGSNNQRKVLQIELANEEVKDDGSNNTARDIVWRIFAIGNECYIALSASQTSRLGVQILDATKGVEFFDSRDNRNNRVFSNNFGSTNNYYRRDESIVSTGNGIYVGRNKDSFMEKGLYINPENLIFLFKLRNF